jgi:FkbM family methyltransferase
MEILDFIKSLNPKILIEIGTHFGTETLKFREILPTCKIISFEPDPRNIEILKKNNIDKICNLEQLAISDKNGKIEFYLSSGDCKHWSNDDLLRDNDWSASSSIKKPKKHLELHKWISFDQRIEVESIRLDDYVPLKNEIVDFIWMDVQGAEDLVFKGSSETLKRTKYIYTEYADQELYESQLNLKGIIDLIGEDWEIVHIFSNDVLLKNKNM